MRTIKRWYLLKSVQPQLKKRKTIKINYIYFSAKWSNLLSWHLLKRTSSSSRLLCCTRIYDIQIAQATIFSNSEFETYCTRLFHLMYSAPCSDEGWRLSFSEWLLLLECVLSVGYAAWFISKVSCLLVHPNFRHETRFVVETSKIRNHLETNSKE